MSTVTSDAGAQFEYDIVELRAGKLYKLRRSEARVLGEQDAMAPVVKCYCRSHDVLSSAEVESQARPTFVFAIQYFKSLESLIGHELVGRVYTDSHGRRVRFYLDLKDHAGFQMEEDNRDLESPWYDDGVLKE